MKTDTGGPAQPVVFQHPDLEGAILSQRWEGMTLLDHFAGQEMGRPSKEIMELLRDEMKAEGLIGGIKDKTSAEKVAVETYFEMRARYRFKSAQAMVAEKHRLEQ